MEEKQADEHETMASALKHEQQKLAQPPPSPGEDAKVRPSAVVATVSIEEGVTEAKDGGGKEAALAGCEAFASPPPPPTTAAAAQAPAPVTEAAPSTPMTGASPAVSAVVMTPSTAHKTSNTASAPASASSSFSTAAATAALAGELCAALRGRQGEGCLGGLPEELVMAHCQGLVRVLREVESLRQHIEREGCMEGDCHSYMKVCEASEQRAAQQRLRALQRLRQDFDEKNAALKKELRGLREQVTTLRGRCSSSAWNLDKKAAILAALLRFDDFAARELKAARQLTESATEGVRAARMQLPKLPEEVDALLELVGKMRRVSKNLAKLGMAHMNEARMAEVWASVVEMLTFRPIGDVLGETKRALADLKDVKFTEAKRRNEQQLRLLQLCSGEDDAGKEEESGVGGDGLDLEKEEEEREEGGNKGGGGGGVSLSCSLLPVLQTIAENKEQGDSRSSSSSSSSSSHQGSMGAGEEAAPLSPVEEDGHSSPSPPPAAAAVAAAVEFEACEDSWAAIFPEQRQQEKGEPAAAPSPPPSASCPTFTASSSAHKKPPAMTTTTTTTTTGGASSSYRPGASLDDDMRRRRLYGGKTQPPECVPVQRASMYVSRPPPPQTSQQPPQSLRRDGSTDSLGSVRSVSSSGFDRPTASSRLRAHGTTTLGAAAGAGGLRGGVVGRNGGGGGGGGSGVAPTNKGKTAGAAVMGGRGGQQPRTQSFYQPRGRGVVKL